MLCPTCRQAMVILELQNVEVDHCITCGGIWLDSGELEILLNGLNNKESLLSSFKTKSISSEPLKKCPNCFKKMQLVSYRLKSDEVVVDRCLQNCGIWFDRHELLKLIELGGVDNENKNSMHNLLSSIFKKGA